MRGQHDERGLTLIEVVTSIVVLGLALPPLIAIFTGVAANTPDDVYQQVAISYANGLLEEISSKRFEDPDLPGGSFGTEEGARAAYDDVDDFDGLSQSPPQHLDGSPLADYGGFTRSAVVDNVTSAAPDPILPQPDGSTDFKRIRVTVVWTGARGGELILTTLRSNLDDNDLSGPLDGPGSVGSAYNPQDEILELALINATGVDLEIQSFSLSASRPVPGLDRFELATDPNNFNRIWDGQEPVPTPLLPADQGSPAERVVPVGGAAGALLEFDGNIAPGPITFTLALFFTDGTSSTLVISFTWVDR